ncbi:hypothetical protein [Mycolicibacterium sp. CBMA 234]|uniref:hypothetical protein n=1 Tax=Mycolicibacterium sp. CBMA 234 TaxID=1918495 RepID=UPI001EE3FBC2|nr:hypothetical protein [Mycolicibacterium sp. CBMA 234]
MTQTRSAVDRRHQFAQRVGGEGLQEPQTFPQYPPLDIMMSWLDPFGVMLETCCGHDPD